MVSAADDAEWELADLSETRRVVAGRIGQIVGGTYRIARHIGSGGSSHVFSADHVRLGKAFAVKLLRTEIDSSRRAAQRFRREAKAIARLQSEHIVSVIDCGELDDQTPYLVMELLEGEDLRSLLNREGSLPPRRAVPIIIEACRGLTVVHDAGLVHRDLKPENLFVTRRAGGEDWCKVLDFGVAKMEASLSTAQGAIIGTVRYMAPEQLSDAESVGPTTDIYALGAVLYECLAGRPMVDGEAVQEVMFRIMNAAPRSVLEVVPTLPKALADILTRCVSRAPTGRPATASELAKLLAAALASPRLHRAAEDTYPEDAFARPTAAASFITHRNAAIGGALATMACAGLMGWSLRKSPNPPDVKPRAAMQQAATTVAASARGAPAAPAEVDVATASINLDSRPDPDGAQAPKRARPARSNHPPSARHDLVSPPMAPSPPAPIGRFDSTNPYGE